MYSYIARRLAFGALTVVGVSIMVFVVMRILPGDPLVAIFGPEGFTKLTEEQRAGYMARARPERSAVGAVPRLGEGHPARQFRPLVLPLRERRRHDPAARAADRRDRPDLGRAVVAGRHPGGDRQRAQAQHHRPTASSRFVSILFLAVPGFWVGMLIVLGAAVLVRLSRADGRRVAVRRSVGQPADRDRPGHRARAGPGRLYRAHGAAPACSR